MELQVQVSLSVDSTVPLFPPLLVTQTNLRRAPVGQTTGATGATGATGTTTVQSARSGRCSRTRLAPPNDPQSVASIILAALTLPTAWFSPSLPPGSVRTVHYCLLPSYPAPAVPAPSTPGPRQDKTRPRPNPLLLTSFLPLLDGCRRIISCPPKPSPSSRSIVPHKQ